MAVNIPIWILASLFGLWETAYFGWNGWPHSDAEIICDGIAFLIFALAFEKARP